MNKELKDLLEGNEELQEMNEELQKVIKSVPNIIKYNKHILMNSTETLQEISSVVYSEDVKEVDVMECLRDITSVLLQLNTALTYNTKALGLLGNCTSEDADI